MSNYSDGNECSEYEYETEDDEYEDDNAIVVSNRILVHSYLTIILNDVSLESFLSLTKN